MRRRRGKGAEEDGEDEVEEDGEDMRWYREKQEV